MSSKDTSVPFRQEFEVGKKLKVALVDTGHANLRSVQRALEEAGKGLSLSVARTHDPELIAHADHIVVPGQGGFGDCLSGLQEGVDQVLREKVQQGTYYLGICLGLQALFEGSEEAEGVKGLGLFSGQCRKLAPAPGIKIPHMGWNQLNLENGGHGALQSGGGHGAWFYFIHSYHAVPNDERLVKAWVQHGPHQVTAAVARDNILATQFHPEKSQAAGLSLLRGFLTQ